MVGTHYVDEPVVPARDLVGEVRDVGGKIRPGPVALLDDAVLVLEGALGGLEEEGAFLANEVPALFELAHDGRHGAPSVERLFAEPDVEMHAEVGQARTDAGQRARPRDAAKHPRDACATKGVVLAFDEELAVDHPQPRGKLGDVRALVTVFRGLATLCRGAHARGEGEDLVAAIVDVVLARDAIPLRLEQARQGVPEDGVPPARHGDRPRRVRADELDVDALSGRGRSAAPGAPGAHDLGNLFLKHRGMKAEVDEPRTGDLRRSDDATAGQPAHERLGDRSGGLPGPLGERHGDVRRKMTVLRAAGALDDPRRAVECARSVFTELARAGHGLEHRGQGRADTFGKGHGCLSVESCVAFQRVSSSSRSGMLSATIPPPAK